MWQVLLAAAVAGSTGLIARHLFSPLSDPSKPVNSDPAPDQEAPEPSTPPATISGLNSSECESSCGKSEEIFRFSSSGTGRARSKCLRKKLGTGSRNRVGNGADGSRGNGYSAHSKSGRKFYFCLKRRKTGKNVIPKCGSCYSKESSSFNYGLGVGIMYMMSAGKAEISRLNTAMDETANVIKELKSEIRQRKSSKSMQDTSSAMESFGSSGRPVGNQRSQANKLKKENAEPNGIQMSLLAAVDDGEYASSVLTEEPEREVMDMNQLEAELESELERLHWSIGETSCEMQPYLREAEAPFVTDHEVGRGIPGSCQFAGVLPSELNKKLSQLLIKQQEGQITELETQLNSTQSELLEKESELQTLKDCVRRLTEFSLSNGSSNSNIFTWDHLILIFSLSFFLVACFLSLTCSIMQVPGVSFRSSSTSNRSVASLKYLTPMSDDETDARDGEERTANWDYINRVGSDPESTRPVVGMKRPMCH